MLLHNLSHEGRATRDEIVKPTLFKRPLLFALLSSLIPILSSLTEAAALPTTLGWYQIPSTAMQLVCPTYPDIQAVQGCAGINDQWGSGLADTKRNRMIIWGGGHSGYYGNEVYSINLNNNPIDITLLHDASHGSALSNLSSCPDAWTDGLPTPKHTGGGMNYLPNQDLYFTHGWGDPPCGGFGNGKWFFNPNTNTWAARLTPDPQPHPDTLGTIPGEAYDPATGRIYNVGGDPTWPFWYYDYNANAWTNTGQTGVCLKPDGNSTTTLEGVIDPGRRLYFCVGGGGIFQSISLNAPFTVKALNGTNCNGIANMNGMPGIEYDPVLQKLVIWMGGDTVYLYNPDTDSCTAQTFSGGPGPQLANGTYGRFRYFPSLRVYVVVNDVSQNAYALRLTNGTPPPPTTSPCDVNGDGVTNVADVQLEVNMALGISPCTNPSGTCTVVSVQRVVNAALGGVCVAP